jgi:hypothetical protein
MDGAYIKAWQGVFSSKGSNGDVGGGGRGLIKNITFRNFEMQNGGLPIQISQCFYTESSSKYCNTSKIWYSPLFKCHLSRCESTSVNITRGLPMYGTNLQKEVFQCRNIIG